MDQGRALDRACVYTGLETEEKHNGVLKECKQTCHIPLIHRVRIWEVWHQTERIMTTFHCVVTDLGDVSSLFLSDGDQKGGFRYVECDSDHRVRHTKITSKGQGSL